MALRVLVMLIAMVSTGLSIAAEAQQIALAGHRPHFVQPGVPTKARVVAEVRNAAVLYRAVSLELAESSVEEALTKLGWHAGVRIAYNAEKLPKRKRISLSAARIEVAAALTQILFESGLDVAVARNGQLAVVECIHLVSVLQTQDSGTIVGHISDKETGVPLVGATVTVEGTARSATTSSDGDYRITGVEVGVYTVRARFIGYAALTTSVTVVAAEEVTAHFALMKSVQWLDEVVTVTPGGMQTEVKALPSPITVITAEDIQRQRPTALSSVFRQAVPTGVSFNIPNQPVVTSLSARGASSLSNAGLVKVFIDGIEAASFDVAAVDPASVERIEVSRGPQAATLYGSDAAGGVVQITTRRGDPLLLTPQVMAKAEGGVVQTPYQGFGSVFRQQYSTSVRGGGRDVLYDVGAGYTRMADWLPNGEISRQSSPSVYGSMRYTRDIISVSLNARYFRNNLPAVTNPELQSTGLVSLSRPMFSPTVFTNETYGTRVSVTPTSWWHNQLTLGTDRFQQDQRQVQRRFATPGDTLLTIFDTERRKVSLFYNSSVTGQLSTDIGASVTAGVDHYRLDATTFFTSQALSTEGTIRTDPPGAFSESRATVTNTGYLGQAELNWRETAFLTAGLRVENNSSFGEDLATPVLPRVGLSVVRPVGSVTVKFRGAYGRAIRAPSPGAAFGEVGPASVTLANPLLAPERQRGWDGGIDLVFGSHGSLSVTGFAQTAEDLIAFLQVTGTPLPTFQYQNVGRVTNRGVEIEGELSLGPAQLRAQYGYVRSRVEDLGPAGSPGAQIQVGDTPLGVPKHTAGASLTVLPWKTTTLTAGATYIGSFRQVDFLQLFGCFGGTAACQPTFRDYAIDYPGFAKVNVAVTQQVTSRLEALVTVDNLTNNGASEGGNTLPVLGRMTMVGLRARL